MVGFLFILSLCQVQITLKKLLTQKKKEIHITYAGEIFYSHLLNRDCRCQRCIAKTLDALQILIDDGAFVDVVDNLEGKTPLYYCAENRLAKPAELLLNNGANINHR